MTESLLEDGSLRGAGVARGDRATEAATDRTSAREAQPEGTDNGRRRPTEPLVPPVTVPAVGGDLVSTLADVASALASARAPEEAATLVAGSATVALGAAGASVLLVSDEDRTLGVIAVSGVDGDAPREAIPLDRPAPAVDAVTGRQPVILASPADARARYHEVAVLRDTDGLGASAAYPLLVENVAIGVLTLGFAEPRALSEQERAFLVALASQSAQALDRLRLRRAEEEARRAAERASAAAREADRAKHSTLALLSTLLETAPIGLAFFDHELRCVQLNDALARINGRPASEYVGRHVSDVLSDLEPSVESDLRRVLETGEPIPEREITGRTQAAGEVRHWRVSYYPVRSRTRELLGVGATVGDITERKRAEAERERLYSELQAFRRTLDTTRDSVYLFDPATLRYFYANQGAVSSTGFTREELLTMTPAELMREFDEERFRALLAPLIDEPGKAVTIATTYRRKDGSEFPAELFMQYVQPSVAGGRVIGIVRDISDRVEARVRLQRLAQSERALNAELRAIIRAMADAVLVLDASGRVLFSNPAGDTFFPDGPVARYEDVQRRVLDPEGQLPRPGARRRQGPVELRVRAGGDRWVEANAFPVFAGTEVAGNAPPAGDALETILFLRDVTDERRSRLARDAFIGVLSHELRTPVTTIFGNAKLLGRVDRSLGAGARRELYSDIEIESERLYRLVEDLLVLAKFGEDAAKDVGNEPLLLQRIVPAIIRSEQDRWPGVRFEALIPANLPAVQGDQTYVEQVVRNLLSNAAKYGGDAARVVVVVDATDEEASVRVLDEGPGFSEDEAENLFELFYRSPSTARKASGAGIGLFVCRRLVEAMSGRMWARPRPTGGAEFGFVLKLFVEEGL